MGDLRKQWQAHKMDSEDKFKKAHAKELLSAATKGMTGYPVKFDKDLGPWLDKFEAATKAKKATDVSAAKVKIAAAITEYRKRITASKSVLADAAPTLETGLKYIEGKLG